MLLAPGGITPDKASFAFAAIPLSLLGPRGARRLNRMIMADQSAPEGVDAAMTLILRHFRSRIGVLPLFSDAELRGLTMPVLLMMGARDVLRDADKIAARMACLVPNVTSIVLPSAGPALLDTPVHILSFLGRGAADCNDRAFQVPRSLFRVATCVVRVR